ncbi:MAG: hypothetical protein AAF713_17820 [Pseudomonadota bacterium]
MKRFALAAVTAVLLAAPAVADEIEETLEAALEAYRAGDIKAAKEEVDFAAQLMAQQKAAGLADFLPEPLAGWTMEVDDTQSVAAFGGGMMASASYSNGNDRIDIQLMADNQMVNAMAAMFGNVAMMGSLGTVKRINRQKVVITNDGELQTMINNRIMVQIMGDGDAAVKEEYFKAMDIDGLVAF